MGTLIHTNDQALFNCIACEVNKLAGMYCYYYVFDAANTTRDPLWDEAEEVVFSYSPDGKKVLCFGVNPEHSLSTGEEGKRTQWDAQLWFARMHWEQAFGSAITPKSGDVVNCWGKYYDIVDFDRDGIMDDDRNIFVCWKVSLRRNTKFDPIRRVVP